MYSPSNQGQNHRPDTSGEDVSHLSSQVTLNSFSGETVLGSLKGLKNKLTLGPDNVPDFLPKDCALALLKPLTFIFNLALESNTFPDIWKKA